VPHDIRALIREMSTANPLWGVPRIHGELQKLGITVCESTVAKYMRRHPRPPSQTWRTFLTNHASQIMAADLFVVPTVTYRLLFVLVILACRPRRCRMRGDRHVDDPSADVGYYLYSRTHLALGKDTPSRRLDTPASAGRIVAIPEVGGLHHRYDRVAA
jgi:hypothetical protein